MKNILIKIKKAGKKIIVIIIATATIIGGGIMVSQYNADISVSDLGLTEQRYIELKSYLIDKYETEGELPYNQLLLLFTIYNNEAKKMPEKKFRYDDFKSKDLLFETNNKIKNK